MQILVSAFLRRKKVTLREIQSLTGLLNFNITIQLEFYPIVVVLSVFVWGDKMRNKRITFYTDNAALLIL
jgi:hypothetical protein